MRPRTNRQVGSATLRRSQAIRVTPARSSSGFMNRALLTKKIDSWLDMFFVNGHHGIVTVSPTIVRNTRTYTAAAGRRIATTHDNVSTSSAIGNGAGALL